MEKPNFRIEILRTLEGKTPAQIPVGTFTTSPASKAECIPLLRAAGLHLKLPLRNLKALMEERNEFCGKTR